MSNKAPGKWDELGVHVVSELERLNATQDELSKTLEKNTLTLEKNTMLLEEHMRRTVAVEGQLDILKKEIEPVKQTQAAIGLLAKIGGGITGAVGAIMGILKLFGFFHHG